MGGGSWLCLPPGSEEAQLRPAAIQSWVVGEGQRAQACLASALRSAAPQTSPPSSPPMSPFTCSQVCIQAHFTTAAHRNARQSSSPFTSGNSQPFNKQHGRLTGKPPDLELEKRRQSLAPAWDPALIPEPP